MPHANGLVKGPADNAVAGQRNADHSVRVPFKGMCVEELSSLGVPHAYDTRVCPLAFAGHGDNVATGHRNALHAVRVSDETYALGAAYGSGQGANGPEPGPRRLGFWLLGLGGLDSRSGADGVAELSLPTLHPLAQLRPVAQPRRIRRAPTTLWLDEVPRQLWRVTPPARVPQTLEQRLRVVVYVPSDEVDVAADRLPNQLQ